MRSVTKDGVRHALAIFVQRFSWRVVGFVFQEDEPVLIRWQLAEIQLPFAPLIAHGDVWSHDRERGVVRDIGVAQDRLA